MSKFGVMISEVFTKSVIIEVDSYEEAEEKITKLWEEGKFSLNRDNADVHLELKDDTAYYLNLYEVKELDAFEQDKIFVED